MTTIAGLARAGGRHRDGPFLPAARTARDAPARPEKLGRLGTGVRRYGSKDVRRLRFVRSAQTTAGFTLEQIGELLSLDAATDHARARGLATAQLAVLDARIEERTTPAAPRTIIWQKRVRGRVPVLCPIIEAFDAPALEDAASKPL
ncbi:MAG: MerR family DNA-binding protein [Hymenobacter sp.]